MSTEPVTETTPLRNFLWSGPVTLDSGCPGIHNCIANRLLIVQFNVNCADFLLDFQVPCLPCTSGIDQRHLWLAILRQGCHIASNVIR